MVSPTCKATATLLILNIDDIWTCAVTKPIGIQDRRCLPELFSVNAESRLYCLEKYVALGNSYVHPTLDFLYITWYWPTRSTRLLSPKFIPVERQLLSKFQTVGMTVARNAKADGRFGALVSCLKALGSPQQIIPCLIGGKMPARYPNQIGFSITNGNAVVILDWLSKHGEDPMAEELLSHINSALEEEKAGNSNFHSPEVVTSLYYMYSGP